jgi:hypothetical protein
MKSSRQLVVASLMLALLIPPPLAAAEFDDLGAEIEFSPEFDRTDRDGLRRDTRYFLGYQWVTIGLLYIAPESVSGWTPEQKKNYSLSIWWDNVKNPQWDSDDAYLNYILHPYWGASYYVRARERGYNDREATLYSIMLSCMYEFGAEALFEEVSVQDLFVTPIGGTLVGRYFMKVRDRIRDREAEFGYRTTRDKWIWTLTDPLGALNRQVDKFTGRNVSVQVLPYRYVPRRDDYPALAPVNLESETVYGIQIHVEW